MAWLANSGKDASSVRRLNYWLSNLVNVFFSDIGLLFYSPTLKRLFPMSGSHLFQFPNLGKSVSSIGLSLQLQILEMLFPMLDFHFTSTNLGNILSNVGLFYIYQPWLIKDRLPTLENYEMTFQCWKLYLFFQYWFSNWTCDNLPMFFQFWNLTIFSCGI